MNKITLIGNSGSDAQLAYSQAGNAYCTFSIATSEKNKDGTFSPTWHRIKMFGRTAETQAPLIKKGSRVFVDGKMAYSEYERDGIKKQSADVIAFTVGVMQKDTVSQSSSDFDESYADQQKSTKGTFADRLVNERPEFTEMDLPF